MADTSLEFESQLKQVAAKYEAALRTIQTVHENEIREIENQITKKTFVTVHAGTAINEIRISIESMEYYFQKINKMLKTL